MGIRNKTVESLGKPKPVYQYWREGQTLRRKEKPKNHWLLKAIGLAGFIGLACHAHAETAYEYRCEKYKPIETFTVGFTMFLSPITLASKEVPVMSGWEHQAFGFTWTELGYKFLPKEMNWLSPIIVGGVFLVYRLDGFGHGHDDANWRKMVNENLGILGAVTLSL